MVVIVINVSLSTLSRLCTCKLSFSWGVAVGSIVFPTSRDVVSGSSTPRFPLFRGSKVEVGFSFMCDAVFDSFVVPARLFAAVHLPPVRGHAIHVVVHTVRIRYRLVITVATFLRNWLSRPLRRGIKPSPD
jgi:hypothetical protein